MADIHRAPASRAASRAPSPRESRRSRGTDEDRPRPPRAAGPTIETQGADPPFRPLTTAGTSAPASRQPEAPAVESGRRPATEIGSEQRMSKGTPPIPPWPRDALPPQPRWTRRARWSPESCHSSRLKTCFRRRFLQSPSKDVQLRRGHPALRLTPATGTDAQLKRRYRPSDLAIRRAPDSVFFPRAVHGWILIWISRKNCTRSCHRVSATRRSTVVSSCWYFMSSGGGIRGFDLAPFVAEFDVEG